MDEIETGIRTLLADVLERDPATVLALPGGTPLFDGELNLGSLAGAKLLASIDVTYGVDIAALDWELASLTSIDTLVEFVRAGRR